MKTIGLVVTIGTRDVAENGKSIDAPRMWGQALGKDLSEAKDRLSFPIIEPIIREIVREGELSQVLLIATDQKSTTSPHKEKDTLHFAAILKQLFPQLFKQCGGRQETSPQVAIVNVDANPTIAGQCWDFLQEDSEFRRSVRQLKELDHIILSTTGGVPGLNSVVQHLSFAHLQEKLEIIHVDEKSRQPVRTDMVRRLMDQHLRNDLEALLESFDFPAAVRRLAAGKNEVSLSLARMASFRLAFNFEDAQREISSLFGQARQLNRLLEEHRQDLCHLQSEECVDRRTLLIRELTGNLLLKWRRQEYVDVLGRLFRLTEENTLNLLTRLSGKTLVYEQKSGTYPELLRFIEDTEGLTGYLESRRVHGQKLDYKRWSIETGIAIITFFRDIPGSALQADCQTFLEAFQVFEKLKQLRNKSIMAHGFLGVARRDFESVLESDDFETLIRKFAGSAIANDPMTPWIQLQKAILDNLA